MSNISKNLFLALSLVCAIVLIVFCIQLIVLNRGVEPVEPGSVVSGGSQQGGSSDPDEDGEEPLDGESGGVIGNVPPTPRPPPQGTRRELGVTPTSTLIIYSRDELFEFEEREIDWEFLYTGGGGAALEISFTVIGPEGVGAHAEMFLNNYTGGTEAEFSGEVSIGGSVVSGYHVTARRGNDTYEAWIRTLVDSDIALVFVINYDSDQQKSALYEMLSTLDIEGASAPINTGGALGAGGNNVGGNSTGGNDDGGDTDGEDGEDEPGDD